MLTPQEVTNSVFEKALLGGYDTASVDKFMAQLTQDYSALYRENGILKAKMKVLVDKVEEYRSTEDAMRKALHSAQKMADQLIQARLAEIVGTPFGDSAFQGTAEQLGQQWNVLPQDLLLKIDGVSAHQYRLAGALGVVDCRYQIGESLPDARWCLNANLFRIVQRMSHAVGHRKLLWPRLVGWTAKTPRLLQGRLVAKE